MLRFLRYIIEFIAAIVGVAIVLVLLLVWRLNVDPVHSDFMTPYIETGIEDIVPGSQVHLGSTLLTWNGDEKAILVHAENIQISNVYNRKIADIPSFDAKISVLGLVFGQFMPKDLAIDHPQIKLERGRNGQFVFGGLEVGSTEDNTAGATAESMSSILRNLSERLSHTALMHRLAVTRAVFAVHDDGTGKDWSIGIPEISIARTLLSERDNHLEYGALDGHMMVEVTQKDTNATVDVHYVFDPTKNEHSFSTTFTDLTPAFIAGGHPETLGLSAAAIADLPLTGKVRLTLDKNFKVLAADGQIHGDPGNLVDSDLWDKPCAVKSFDMSASYDGKTPLLKVYDTRLDLNGTLLDLQADGIASTDKRKDLGVTATLKITNMPMNRYGELWPKPVLPNPRYWLDANLRDGVFTRAEATVKADISFSDLANPHIIEGSGRVSAVNGRVIYLDGMPAAENVNAEATFDLQQMAVQVTGGGIGNIRLSPFTIRVTGLSADDQIADIPLQVSGPISDVMRLLEHKPLGYAKKLGLSPDDIGGHISGLVSFHFPLLRTLEMKDLAIHANADATDVASTKVIPGIAIDQGNLTLTMDMEGFNLKGPVALGKAPFQVNWQQYFDEKAGRPLRHIIANGVIKEDQWPNFGISLFKGSKGSMNVTVDMTNPTKRKTQVTGTLDMTPAAVQFDLLSWKKAAGAPAILKLTTSQADDKPVTISSLSLHGAQIMANGNGVLAPDMSKILSLNLTPLILGRTNASLHITQSYGENGFVRVAAKGASLDASAMRGGDDSAAKDTRPKEYHVELGKLYTSANGVIEAITGSATRDKDGWSAIDLQGLANADTPLHIELTPQSDGHRTFSIETADFGKAMKGLGFTDTISGGTLSVKGESTVDNPRLIVGHAKITDFSVHKLPALALLLNATSPFGITGLLTDSASFSHLTGDFRWQGDMLTITHANAAGSAVGINIDGKVDMATGDANLEGTLVPFSVVNKIINYIPVIGPLITGGDDQGVLAVAYQIKGGLNAPKISVNPISLLTPGFIRNLFFGDDLSDDNQDEGKKNDE